MVLHKHVRNTVPVATQDPRSPQERHALVIRRGATQVRRIMGDLPVPNGPDSPLMNYRRPQDRAVAMVNARQRPETFVGNARAASTASAVSA